MTGSSESVADAAPEKRQRCLRTAETQKRKIPPAFQSEIEYHQHVETRGTGALKAEWEKNKQGSTEGHAWHLLQPRQTTKGVAPAFSRGRTKKDVIDIFFRNYKDQDSPIEIGRWNDQ